MTEMVIARITQSPGDTADFGRELGAVLRAGDLLSLEGELGAGKTTLVRGIAEGLGADPARVSSPTFVIAAEHPSRKSGNPTLVHVDAYRLESSDDLDSIGWDRLTQGDVVLAVEWASRIQDALPEGRVRVTIEHIQAASDQEDDQPSKQEGSNDESPTTSARRIVVRLPISWQDRKGLSHLGLQQDTVCRVTGESVPADSPTWPFASERARMADLYRWFSGEYSVQREIINDEDED